MQPEKKGLSGNNSTPQTKSVSLHETTLKFHIDELTTPKEKVEITFKSAMHVGSVVSALVKILKFAHYGMEAELVSEKLESYEITDCLELIYKLIPYGTLEIYDDIKHDFINLNNFKK